MSYMRVYYYENELEDEFSSASIKAKKIDADYDYSMDSAGRRFLHFFYIAARNNKPELPVFITMSDSDVIDAEGFYVQEYTVHFCEPIYPDPSKKQADS